MTGPPDDGSPGPRHPDGDGTADDPATGAPPDARRLAEQRDEVIAALGRLADGTFARCDICGVQISDRRLRLSPAADRCPDHLLHRHPDSDRHHGGYGRPGPNDDGNDDDHDPS